jgi:hypothetical protein
MHTVPVIIESKIGEACLPQDQEDQIGLGIKIIQKAHQTRVHSLEQEIRSLRIANDEQRTSLSTSQKQKSALEVELVESHQRSQQLAEENKELFKTVNSLRKQLARLENLKNVISSSLQDDAQDEAAAGDIKALTRPDYLNVATPLTARFATEGVQALTGPRAALHEPFYYAGMQVAEPYGYSSPGINGAMNRAPSPPPMRHEQIIDGKEFFKEARTKLSYQAFNDFLKSIKKLNSQQQTREDTLQDAKQIFGYQLQDLYQKFEQLLNKNTM